MKVSFQNHSLKYVGVRCACASAPELFRSFWWTLRAYKDAASCICTLKQCPRDSTLKVDWLHQNRSLCKKIWWERGRFNKRLFEQHFLPSGQKWIGPPQEGSNLPWQIETLDCFYKLHCFIQEQSTYDSQHGGPSSNICFEGMTSRLSFLKSHVWINNQICRFSESIFSGCQKNEVCKRSLLTFFSFWSPFLTLWSLVVVTWFARLLLRQGDIYIFVA